MSRVRMPSWFKGRVAVVGDAASCVSLFGDGSSTAMIGAYCLAQTLAAHGDDYPQAFRQYEVEHRKLVDPRLRHVGLAAALLVPATRPGIAARNLTAQLLPLAAAMRSATARRAA